MRSRVVVLSAFIAVLAGAPFGGAAADTGVLQRFAPQSATTWWAVVASNLTAKVWVVRTADGGTHWRDVSPPVRVVSSSFFLGARHAWIQAGALRAPATEPVYRTLDGGRDWQRLARVPTGCELHFVDVRHGWCAWLGAASGSEGVRLYRTVDGGSRWTLVSRTAFSDAGSTPDALPLACGKALTFTSRTVGWATSVCTGNQPYIERTLDGGTRWRPVGAVPLPPGASAPEGVGLSGLVVSGSDLAVSIDVGGRPGVTGVATSSDDGASWRSQRVPLRGPVDLVDARHWRATDGRVVLSTDDAGRQWRRSKALVTMVDSVGTPLRLDFLTPRRGFAVPADAGPLWRTSDGGANWTPVRISAGPFTLPH